MQSATRRMLARSRVGALLADARAAMRLQAATRRALDQRRQHRAATTVQRTARRMLGRARFVTLLHAATTVQAWMRRSIARTRYMALLADGQRTRAATLVQAHARGLPPRRMYARQQLAARTIQRAARARRARCDAHAVLIQAAVRCQLARCLLPRARAAAKRIQAKWRTVRVRILVRALSRAVEELRQGSVLWKYFEGGIRSEHQRRVWLSNDLDHICWAKLEAGAGGAATDIKAGSMKRITLSSVSAVADDIKTNRMKRVERRKEGILDNLSERLLGASTPLKGACCFSILAEEKRGQARTLDLMTDSRASRDRWLHNLRLLLVHRHTIDAVGSDGLVRLLRHCGIACIGKRALDGLAQSGGR